jgi:hypothetical protein
LDQPVIDFGELIKYGLILLYLILICIL